MKILCCHNYYQQRGGEDQSFEDEVALLRDNGCEVVTYTRHNDEIREQSQLSVAKQTIWSRRAAREVAHLLRVEQPDVMHCTNTFPLLSPSVYAAAQRRRVPVVQSLRNYRWACIGGSFFRAGQVCEDCLGRRLPTPGVRHRCYRGSLAGSLVTAAMQTVHRRLRTLERGVDVFYTLTEFARAKCIEAGLPGDRIVVKPNCVQPDPGSGSGRGGYAVFVGRLTEEKGVRTLLDAWRTLDAAPELRVIGGGPLEDLVAERAASDSNIRWLGPMDHAALLEQIGDARALIIASRWYETFGRTIIEAYAKGTPVIASRLGAMQELVREGVTGELFSPGDSGDLGQAVRRVWASPADQARAQRAACRQEYESHYTPADNFARLMAIYRQAIAGRPAAARRSEPWSPVATAPATEAANG